MAIKPDVKNTKLNASSVDILNAVRAKASPEYRNLVPRATADTASIRQIGGVIMEYTALQNEFLSSIYNRIARVLITSRTYYNPWTMFKKGLLEMGETVEEIFVNIAKGHTFDPDVASREFMKREMPDVRAAFHTMNYQKFYKVTVSNDQLRQAFLSWQGITDLISKIVDSLYTAANYDEFIVMKYMLARNILNGMFYPITVPSINKDNASDIVTEIKAASNMLEYMSTDYNYAGVANHTPKVDQFVITTARFNAIMDVNVLASAFNMDKVQFMGNMVQIDGFDAVDNARLTELFADDPRAGYVPLTDEELQALAQVPAIIVGRDYFMIFDNLYKFTEDYNGEGLYWQYWYHTWKTFSSSPFENNLLFVPGEPTVTAVTVSPASATVSKGANLRLTADVVTTNFAPQTVTWTVNSELSRIDSTGMLYVDPEETETTLTVTATSVFDTTKSGTSTITVA